MPKLFHAVLIVLASQNTVVANCVSSEWSLTQCGDTCLVMNTTNSGTECASCVDNQCVAVPAAEGSSLTCTGNVADYCDASFSDAGCNGVFCEEDEYCWNPEMKEMEKFNTTECIPKTFPCGGQTCPNNPRTVCALDTGSCQSIQDVCEGVRDVAANCADETSWSRWTLAKDGIATKKTKDVCEYELGTCGEEVPSEGGGSSTSVGNSWIAGATFTTVLASVAVSAFV